MRIVIFILFFNIFNINNNYRKIFYNSYDNALELLQNNKSLIVDELGNNNYENSIKLSLVFPELIRYSMFKDLLETRALELMYVNYGKDIANFSIGYFQMKPSFIEEMENYIETSKSLKTKFSNITNYKVVTDKEKRKIRINRIKTLKWQLRYLNCFYYIMSDRFNTKSYKKTSKTVRFYSSAYYHDFLATEEEIHLWEKKRIFPYGMKNSNKQYSYTDIAVYFFKNHSKKIVSTDL
ncbi:MAG: hypothetical protein PF487_02595 [Bacteroidales bacterium]|jgi:hypothetical protein|nr:hypothetical protein [Bacteroidales bacterium]